MDFSSKEKKAEIRPLLAVFALLLMAACRELAEEPHLQGTFTITRYTDENGILHAAWPGEHATFTADCVHFFALIPVHDLASGIFVGHERKDKGSYAIHHLPHAVRIDGHTFKVTQTDSIVWLMGQRSIELKPTKNL